MNLLADVTAGLIVHPAVVAAHVSAELPFMATENVLMAGVRAGGSRQELHEKIRKHALDAAQRIKGEGADNDLLARMQGDPALAPHVADAMEPMAYVGRAPQQVDEVLGELVQPLLDAHRHRSGRFASRVKVWVSGRAGRPAPRPARGAQSGSHRRAVALAPRADR